MKKHQFIVLVLLAFSLYSCSSEMTEDIGITLVFDKPLEEGKYPAYIKDFVMPFTIPNCEKNILLKPIYFVRADIKRTEVESNAWYFKDIGENTVEFSTNFLTQYFTDSLATKYLTSPTKNKSLSIKSYLKSEADVVLIYSEESDKDSFEGIPVYNTATRIQEVIKETSCNNAKNKVTVIINPKALESPETGGINALPITTIKNPCGANTVADGLDLKDDLLKIIDTKRGYKERDKLAKAIWSKYFDAMAAVTMYLKTNQQNPEGRWESGDGSIYLVDRLAYMNSITDINITRIEYHRDTKKITGITVVECHNASDSL